MSSGKGAKGAEGVLYLVATPIGNLKDMTIRGLKVLREVDLIAAEDTREARKLLGRYRVKRPLLSFHEHNEKRRIPVLMGRLRAGEKVALISDAGTPGISDPGWRLVRRAHEEGIRVVPVPGPSAVIAALVASGLPTDSFHFLGFLPPKGGKRQRRLEEIRGLRGTVVLFEAPHRILRTLEDLLEVCGDREVAVMRELTKLHEEVIRGRLKEVKEEIERRGPRGEMTIVLAGKGFGGDEGGAED